MTLTIPGPPPEVPPLEPDSAGASSVASARRAASTAQDVAEWATGHGAPENWSGDASEAAGHALTALAGDLDAAVAAMNRVTAALDTFYDEVTDLESRRTDLVEERGSLSTRQALLALQAASYEPSEEAGLRERARSLRSDSDALVTAIETWQRDTTAAEDTLISALQASDTPAEAHRYAATGAADADELIASLIDQGTLPAGAETATPEELRQWLIDNPDAASTLMDRHPEAGDGALGRRLADVLPEAGGDPDAVRRLFDSLPPDDASVLAMLYPGVVGDLPGAPFGYRADANTVAVAEALAAARAAADQRPDGLTDRENFELAREQVKAEERIPLLQSILDNDRQILFFDPSGDGSIAELHGPIGPETKNLGIFVPGAKADLAGFDSTAERAQSFVEGAPDRDLAMISWTGGDFPDNVFPLASDPGYAEGMAPDLADFSHQVRQELDHSAAADNDVRTTVLGHSYGGAVVGLAETEGLDADRVLHVASAGSGHDVWGPDDLPASQQDVDRYSMTAPGDFIDKTQGQQVLGVGHGADPDTFPGSTRLDTGDDTQGDPTYGDDPHSGIFQRDGDAWRNMLGVLTGDEAVGYRFPDHEPYESEQSGWGEPGERIEIP